MKAQAARIPWTTPGDIRAQARRLWDKGILPAALTARHIGGEDAASPFPRRLVMKRPTSIELAERFDEVRAWITQLTREAKYYRIVWRKVNHRIIGANSIPVEIWIDSPGDALRLIGKGREAEKLTAIAALTQERQPELMPWLAKRPLRVLELADDWPRLLDIVDWLRRHSRPGIYLRQIDIPGVHSKFIEKHRAVLGELFDLTLPPAVIDKEAVGVGGFCRRYGFRDKPVRPRFRILDPALSLFNKETDQDIAVPHETFARLDLPVKNVFITENEINFLAFPATPRSMVIFGAGYGCEMLSEASWLHDRDIYYWGDIDTHGFAILDQWRAHFPQAKSFLMDRDTLHAHRVHWCAEPKPETRDLHRLTDEEQTLYDDLRNNRLGNQVRLEQERIGFAWFRKSLQPV